jgi:hypothetical protein
MSRPTYSGGALDDPSVSAALDDMEGMHEMQTFRFQQGNQSTVNAVDELEFRGNFFFLVLSLVLNSSHCAHAK